MSNTTLANWWSGTFQVERKCTCKRRSAECLQLGWHVVSSSNDRGAALAETRQLAEDVGVPYRTIDSRNREVIERLEF